MKTGMESSQPAFERFNKLFKKFMGPISGILLPTVTSAFNLLPIYAGHKNYFTVWTPIFCFGIWGFVFFSRAAFARNMFFTKNKRMNKTVRTLPFILMVSAFALIIGYFVVLQSSLRQFAPDVVDPLSTTDLRFIPQSALIILLFILPFILLQAVFVIFALREFIVETMDIKEQEQVAHQEQINV